MKWLILTVGLPRSGKSTWARSMGWPIVNPDSIRLVLSGADRRSYYADCYARRFEPLWLSKNEHELPDDLRDLADEIEE